MATGRIPGGRPLTRDSDSLQAAELSQEQLDDIKGIFSLFDQDGTDTITIAELGTCMRALGQNPTEAEMQAIIAEIDADGNGIIEYPEFVDLMSRRPWGVQGSRDELHEAFSVFDPDGTGYVRAAVVRDALTSMGEALTDEQIDKMFSQVCPDGEGRVPYEDFVKIMMDL